MYIELVGYIAGLLIAITMVPQIITSVRTKNVEGVSKAMLLIFFSSMILWFVYGILIKNYPIIVTNGIAALISGIQVFIKFKYSTKT